MMSHENTPQYEYTHLPANCIRVLQISSLPAQNNVEITLKVISLDRIDKVHPLDNYDCLSYTWGDPRDPKLPVLPMSYIQKDKPRRMNGDRNEKIYIQGQYIKVSENCLHALKRLSGDRQRRQWIWIDAICIDQTSRAEKAQQIPLMGKIYQRADNVIIWLGQEDRGTRDAHNLLQTLSRVDPNSEILQSRAYNIDPAQAYEQLMKASNDMGMTDVQIENWLHLAHFLQRAWFSRVWVVQEVFFSRHMPRVFIGEHELIWEHIMQSMDILQRTNLDTVLKAYIFDMEDAEKPYNIAAATAEVVENRLANAHIFGILHEKKRDKKQFRLDRLLYYTRYFNATEPEDHIYGIQDLWKCSLADDELTTKALPPYPSPFQKVYIEAMRIAILETGRLDILGLRGKISEGLPSWVIDFRQKPQLYPLTRNLEFEDHPRRWQAGKGIIPTAMQEIDTSDSKKLSVDGFDCDEVSGCLGPSFQEVDTCFRMSKLLQILATACQDAYSAIDLYPAFLRTIIKDTYPGAPTHAEISDSFSAFLALRVLEHEDELNDVTKASTRDENNQLANLLRETEDTVNELFRTYSTFPSWPMIQKAKLVLDLDDSSGRAELDNQAMIFGESFRIAYFGRRLFQTKKGYFGITSDMVEEGDRVWISSSSDTPLVLRPQTKEDEYVLIGEAYIHGIMNGEAVDGTEVRHAYIV